MMMINFHQKFIKWYHVLLNNGFVQLMVYCFSHQREQRKKATSWKQRDLCHVDKLYSSPFRIKKKKNDTLLFAMGNIFDKLHAKKSDLFHESHSAWFAYHFAFNIFTLVIFVSLDMKWPLIFHSQFVLYFLQVLQNDITIYLELLRKSAFICMFLVRIEKSM